MSKDREGNFHPDKGRPSGKGKVKGIVQPSVNKEAREQQSRLEEKYGIDPDKGTTEGAFIRHPNRNRSKDNGNRMNSSGTGDDEIPKFTPEELIIELSKDLLEELEAKQGTCISIYFGTHKQGVEVNDQVDPTIFKNALQQAEAELKSKVNNSVIEKMMKPAYELLCNRTFWHDLPEGLAFFISENFFKYIRLPFAPESATIVNSSFHVTQLVPFLPDNKYFFILVLSKSRAALYSADKTGIQEVNVPGMPYGMDVIHFEEKYGKYDKDNIATYLAEVDRTLWKEILHKEHAPLLLAAVDYIVPVFKKITQYHPIWDQALIGNFERENENALHEKALRAMNSFFTERTKLALTEFGDRSATALTSTLPADIIPGAYYARVAHLFVRAHDQLWGNFDEVNNELTTHEQWRNDDDDLLDKAVLQTLLNGGEVHILEPSQMPVDSKLAAVFRY